MKGWEKNIPANRQGKHAGVAMFISDEIDFKSKAIKRETEGHFRMFKGRIYQEDIGIVNIYAPNIGVPKCIRKILEKFKKDIDSNTLPLGDFNTHCQQWIGLPNKGPARILWH